MKRSPIAICILLALSLCACQPGATSSSSAVSEDTPSSSAATSSENASSSDSSEVSSSIPAEKVELEIDHIWNLHTLDYGRYINSSGMLTTDRTFSDADCSSGDNKDEEYERRFSQLELSPDTTGISDAMDYAWDVFIIDGKIHLTDYYLPCINADQQENWDKQRAETKTYLASLPEVQSIFVTSENNSIFLGAVFPDGTVAGLGDNKTVMQLTDWNVVSAAYYGTTVNGGILGLNPDGTLSFAVVSGEVDADFSALSNVVAFSAYRMDYREEEEGFITCLLSDGTLIATDGKTKRVIAENVVKMDPESNIYLTSDNKVSCGGEVSDWRNVAYLKYYYNCDTAVAAMKDGTVEVVSPGDAPQVLLDFFNSITDLKVTQ